LKLNRAQPGLAPSRPRATSASIASDRSSSMPSSRCPYGPAHEQPPRDPYSDWTSTLREQARAAHLRALRALARLARRGGDVDEAVARLLELLDLDPYDEAAHVDTIAVLTAAGRHGEARRARERYADAMRALGIAI
jgi:DNA-binding SARP family transcriptional activator